jgi:hypothetical protein
MTGKPNNMGNVLLNVVFRHVCATVVAMEEL